MSYIEGTPRERVTLFPEAIDDYITPENPVRFIDAFVDHLDLQALGFERSIPNSNSSSPLLSWRYVEALCLWLSKRCSYEPQIRAGKYW